MCSAGTTACVVGIDPGSTFLGLSTIYFDVSSLEITQIHSKTLYGSRYIQNEKINDSFGGTQSMLIGHRKYLWNHFNLVSPLGVFCESPFYNSRMPAAFGSLIKTLEYIKNACILHDPYMKFATVDPPTAKKAIGASGGSRDKADMIKALEKMPFYKNIIFEEVTEHAVDSVAIGYWGYKNFILSN